MNYLAAYIIAILLLTDTCEPEYTRTIRNNTKYGIEIINYANATPLGSDTFTYIDPFSEFSVSSPTGSGPFGFFQSTPFSPKQTDSLVINFYLEGTDTVYHKVFNQYDTTQLFQCLTRSYPSTCFIKERHLKSAKLVIK